MGPAEMHAVAELIGRTLRARTDESEVAAVRADVADLCAGFPPYPDLLG
jgi:glycine/serine hydroxymethyltransferase